MLLLLPVLAMAQTASQVPQLSFYGESVGIEIARADGSPLTGSKTSSSELIERYFAKDAAGKWRQILCTPTDPAVALSGGGRAPTALRRSGIRLFDAAPSLAFQTVRPAQAPDGQTIRLERRDPSGTIVKTVFVPQKGRDIKVALECTFAKQRETIEYFLDSLAFAPDGKPLSKAGKPDSTFTPGLRKADNQVVGDHFFRAPMISAQKGPLAAILMPDVGVLAQNRPIPTIVDLDADNGVADATLMTYGFCDHMLTGHVWYAHDASMIKVAPQNLKLAYRLILDAGAEPFAAYRQGADYTWDWYGRETFDKVLPQAMPFAEYAKVSYPAAFNEQYGANKLGWFEVKIDGRICGGIPSGWGYQQGWVSWQCWFMQLRSAWGLHWWGRKLNNPDWIDKSNKMLNLALAAPMDRGACPTTYQSREKTWKGSLIAPSPDCYYDLTNMAWKGIWLLRWLEFEDCPRRDDILVQVMQMAKLMVRMQNADGSFPTWLTRDLKVVPILDHSAQTALPAWFLGEIASNPVFDEASMDGMPWMQGETQAGPAREVCRIMLLRAADFLVKNVVDQQRWYDFETFFSCSPKQCLQTNGKLDDPAMYDLHTLSPPQNTLSMQWAAEALMKAAELIEPTAWQDSSGLRLNGSRRSNQSGDKSPKSKPKLPATSNPQSETRNPKSDLYLAYALKSLDIMNLYQNAWNISYRKTAYTFGGFGVQNTDGEYDDARQAQFGCTLADFGAMLGRRDYFERGVAATRASMTLINHPLHIRLNLYPNPNYPLGLQPENCCHGGTDHQAGRSGFDWAEGSGLASMAWLLDRFGSVYSHDKGKWTVGVDGILAAGNAGPYFDLVDFAANLGSRRTLDLRTSGGNHTVADATFYPSVLSAGLRGKSTGPGQEDLSDVGLSVELSGLGLGEFKGDFVAADGSKRPAIAAAWSEQSGVRVGSSLQTAFPGAWNGQEVRLVGRFKGVAFEAGPWVLYLNPMFTFSDWRMPGWTIEGNIAETPTWSNRMDFGIPKGEGFIGTCEDGKGGFDDSFRGTLVSPVFTLSKPRIRLMVGGGKGQGVFVELQRSTNPEGGEGAWSQAAIARGQDSERMREVVWDVKPKPNERFRIRIVDNETGGWGHINVGRIVCGE